MQAGAYKRVIFAAAVAAIATVTVAHVLYYFPRTVDDMYIFLRYAENLAQGNGLVYNLGERVEGFSSPAWVGLLALGELVGVGGVTYTKLLALVFLVGLLVGLYRFGRERLGVGPFVALLAPAFTAFNSYVISWALWGLETPAYLALMVWSAVTLGRLLDAPSRRRRIAFWLVASAFCLMRPEAPFFMALIAVALIVEPMRWQGIKARFVATIRPAAGVLAVFGSYVLFRRLYFGLWLPHTYYAKEGGDFETAQWEPLWAQGAAQPEVVMVGVGAALALWAGLSRRSWIPLFVASGTLYFVGSVLLDWMPNQRHFLPIWLVLPLLYGFGVGRLVEWARSAEVNVVLRAGSGLAALGLLVSWVTTANAQARIDSRFSPNDFATHGQGETWVWEKTGEKWHDTWLCLQRERPPHVEAMHPFYNGMITQLYYLLEYEPRPLDEVWFVARDIGRVGWLSPASVFDNDGLFTPDVVASEEWLEDGSVTDELIRAVFDRPVGMTELYGNFLGAARRDPEVRARYEPVSRGDWLHLRPRGSGLPTPEQILDRYAWALERMPQSHYTMTLYGQGVGAALERRAEIVAAELADNGAPMVDAAPDGLVGGGVILDDIIEVLGCAAEPTNVSPGAEVMLACYFRPLGPVRRDYTVFAHVERVDGGVRVNADHLPAAGRLPSSDWPTDQIIRDATRFTLPADGPPTDWRILLGLFDGNHRAQARPADLTDGDNRVLGPLLRNGS